MILEKFIVCGRCHRHHRGHRHRHRHRQSVIIRWSHRHCNYDAHCHRHCNLHSTTYSNLVSDFVLSTHLNREFESCIFCNKTVPWFLLLWVAAVPAAQRRKGEGEGSSWCSGKLTWKSTDWCENGHGQAFYTQRVVAKPLKLFSWMIYTPRVSATFMSPVAKYEIHEI